MKYPFFLSAVAALLVGSGACALDLGAALNTLSKPQTSTQQESSKSTADTSLIGSLTSSLGITETQATGGTAAILNDASKNMNTQERSSLTSAVPALQSFMGGSTASSSSQGGLLGSVMSNATVSQQFESLGMDPQMVNQFVPVILDYVQSEGGSEMMNLLKGAL